jgi:tRNA dimethylallyltransferase
LEVWHASGKPLSSFHTAGNASGWPPAALLSLEPTDRAWLHARIAARFDAMLSSGFIAEVQALRSRGDLHADLPSMRCVGYRQAWEALDGRWPIAELRDRGIAATRQLAKRQITWLRGMPQRRVVAAEAPDAIGQVVRWVRGIGVAGA